MVVSNIKLEYSVLLPFGKISVVTGIFNIKYKHLSYSKIGIYFYSRFMKNSFKAMDYMKINPHLNSSYTKNRK